MLGILQHRSYKRVIAGRLSGSASGEKVPAGGRSQKIFNRATFTVMGRLAKIDGRVTADEVQFASSMMRLLGIKPHEQQEVIDYFELGKQLDTDVLLFVEDLVGSIGRRSDLARLFLKLQIRLVHLKGSMRLKEKMLLRDVAELLGYDKPEFLRFCGHFASNSDALFSQKPSRASRLLSNAYQILQLAPDADDGEIRPAYLRLMTRYHPDKLVRDNLSDEAQRIARGKAADVRTAYEEICGFRKLRA